MSLVQLESFVAVAEEGTMGRAARRLRVAQPPLTRRIQGLEEELGVQLFARSARGMRLLPPGEVLLPHAREILARVHAVRDSVLAVAAEGADPSNAPRDRPVENDARSRGG